MDDLSTHDEAVELLQQLGLKEYEAKCFVALMRLPHGTAKEISEISDVPRTRVYDAAQVLETKGLIEVQHVSPQQFRAVSSEEAIGILREEYETRTASLQDALQGLESVPLDQEEEAIHEVWALSGSTAITNRTRQLLDEAEQEIVLVTGREDAFTDDLVESLQAAQRRGVSPLIGTVTAELRESAQQRLSGAEVFVSGLEWLHGTVDVDDETEISRLLLVDRSTILVSTVSDGSQEGRQTEKAVFGQGFDNGLVTIVRRLMATGLRPSDDPEHDTA